MGKLESPKMPMPYVVVETIVMAQVNVDIAVKAGPRRDAIHKNSGDSEAMANSTIHG